MEKRIAFTDPSFLFKISKRNERIEILSHLTTEFFEIQNKNMKNITKKKVKNKEM